MLSKARLLANYIQTNMTNMYLFDIRIQKDQPVFLVLSKTFGLGVSRSKFICMKHNIKETDLYSAVYLTDLQILLEKYIKTNYFTGVELKRTIISNIKKKININSYKGFRHAHYLPVNGQRTHTNAQTAKKKRKRGGVVVRAVKKVTQKY